MSGRDSASIQARIVKILGPQVGPVVARDVIDRAIPHYGWQERLEREHSQDMFKLTGEYPPREKKRRGRPKSRDRQELGAYVAFILKRAGVPLSKSHTGRIRIPRGGKFAKVLVVVFEAVGEPVPSDMFDIIEATLAEVEWRENMYGIE